MPSLRSKLAVLSLLLLASTASAQLSITTQFVSNNGQDGNMFDIRGVERLQIVGFDVSLDAGTFDVEIYTTTSGGSYVGSETTAADWTLIGSYPAVLSAGLNVATLLPQDLDVEIAAGTQRGFYVTTTAGAMNYTNGDGLGTVEAGNAFIEVLEGVGKGYPFAGTFGFGASGREWNGSVHYRVIKEANYCEDFDSVAPGTVLPLPWEQIEGEADPMNGADVDWIARSAATTSFNTGPNADHTSGFGNYVYVEDSLNDHATVTMRTPLIDLDAFAQPIFSFWYHSQVSSISPSPTIGDNELSVRVLNRSGVGIATLLPAFGDNGSDWQQLLFDMSNIGGVVMMDFSVNNLAGGGSFVNDIAIDDVCIEDGGFDFFGTGDDIVFGTQVDGNGGRLNPNKPISAGQQLSVNLFSPNGTLPNGIPVILGQFYFDMTPPGSVLADVYVDTVTQFPAFVVFDGSVATPLGPTTIDAGEISLNFVMPPVGALFSLRLQGLVLSPQSNNGIYSASVGHTLDIN